MSPIVSHIRGAGFYVPSRIVTNDDLSQTLDTSHQWIVERTGIHQRHIASEDQTTSYLATEAARSALHNSGVDPGAIDVIILATSTPDHTFPATAPRIQASLGLQGAVSFDVSAVCSGFLVALATADTYLRQGLGRHALVIGAETHSRIVDWSDRTTAVLFGDGAGAMVLSAAQEISPQKSGFLTHNMHSNGKGYDLLYVNGGVSQQKFGYIKMEGREVFKYAVTEIGNVIVEALETTGLSINDIDWIVPHQANSRIIMAVADRLGFPADKFIQVGNLYGNTGAASVPIAFCHGWQDQRIRPQQKVLFVAFGAGFTWGASIAQLP